MFALMNPLKLQITPGDSVVVNYNSREEDPMFDLCDYEGNLIKTGKLTESNTELSIKNLAMGIYYLFILDGPHIHSKKFSV